MTKFVRRYRGRVSAVLLLLLALVGGAVGTFVQWQKFEAKAAELKKTVDEFNQLAVVVRYDHVVASEQDLYPAWPKNLPATERWLNEQCTPLLNMRGEIERTVARLRKQTLPRTKKQEAADLKKDPAQQSQDLLRDTLVGLLGKLDDLEKQRKAAVLQRQRWAQALAAGLCLHHPEARIDWNTVREQLRSSANYRGQSIDLQDENVLGLLPLGPNPATGYFEFYHLRSAWDGTSDPWKIPIPQHRANGSIEVTGATGIVFVLLPGGTFAMGAQRDPTLPNYDEHAVGDESPVHDVKLEPFFLARHELTRAQWRRLAGEQPTEWKEGVNYSKDPFAIGPSHPADLMSWIDANRWMERYGLVLPTEAQWEYGCRAGTTTAWWPGSDEKDLQGRANVRDLTSFDSYPYLAKPSPIRDGYCDIAPVGSFQANPFGLFDMHGNLWEWCRDWYTGYESGAWRTGDGYHLVESSSGQRVTRGGCHVNPAVIARSANRGRDAPSIRYDFVGMRPARTLLH